MTTDILEHAVGDGSGPLSRLLMARQLHPVYQPIVRLTDGSLRAHEALIRGPAGLPLSSPDALFAAARQEGLLVDFEIACLNVQIRRWGEVGMGGRLFLNISASTLIELVARHDDRHIVEVVQRWGLQPSSLTLEITEHEMVADKDGLQRAVARLHAAGAALALDDFGDGRSSLRLWSELAPDVVKIDKYFTRGVENNAQKVQTLKALLQIAEVFGTELVAEGIETDSELRVLRDLGITLGQGYRLGRPLPLPVERPSAESLRVIQGQRVSVLPHVRNAPSPRRLRELQVLEAEPLTPQCPVDAVAERFHAHAHWHAVAVVDQGRPVGLIGRHQFMEQYSRQYFRELFGRRPCLQFANLSPRVIERDQTLSELLDVLTSHDQRYLAEGYIVTEGGRYAGLGTSEQLVRNVTESRIEAARHANPLTFLPGNIPISEHIDRLLASQGTFTACYADLSHFKPFNDYYGYWQGDAVIRMLAQVIGQHVDPSKDFIGHVGGDDFIVLFQSDDWRHRCDRMIEDFDHAVRDLYDPQAQAAGGIVAEDRDGVERQFPFTSLYIGAVEVTAGLFSRAEQVANAAARARQVAKKKNAALVLEPAPLRGLPARTMQA